MFYTQLFYFIFGPNQITFIAMFLYTIMKIVETGYEEPYSLQLFFTNPYPKIPSQLINNLRFSAVIIASLNGCFVYSVLSSADPN